MDYIEIIKENMIELNLNQKQLSITLGLSQSQISQLLSGKYKPGYDTIQVLCQKLKISPNILFDTNESDTISNSKKLILPTAEVNILDNYRKLDKSMQKLVEYYVQNLLDIEAERKSK